MATGRTDDAHHRTCPCVEGRATPREQRFVGVDKTRRVYGEVTVERCQACGRAWLEYRVEDEAFTGSGRWFRGRIDEVTAGRITPEEAAATLEGLESYLFGGSYFGHAARRSSGPLRLL
jgi:hypothetical protein